MTALHRCYFLMIGVSVGANTSAEPRHVPSRELPGTSVAVLVDDVALLHTTQLFPTNGTGDASSESAAAQFGAALAKLDKVLAAGGSSRERLVKLNVYARDVESADAVRGAIAKGALGSSKPAVSFVCGKLADPKAAVALDAVAITDRSAGELLSVSKAGEVSFAAAAVLPAGGAIYVAGQAEKGKDLAEATSKTLDSLARTLSFLGVERSDIVQVKSFLRPIEQKDVVDRELVRFFADQPVPPAVYVEWISTLPIEIELVVRPKSKLSAGLAFATPPGMQPSPVFSRVALVGPAKRVYTAGLYASKQRDGAGQVRDLFAQLQTICAETGADLRQLAKATYYVSADDSSSELNRLRPEYYDPARPPSASKAVVPSVGLAGRTITLDMIAVGK